MSIQREGQRAFNDLYNEYPEIADKIRGTLKDPFHQDSRLPAFKARVEELLALQEEEIK